ncbi:hypothetical protein EVAR_29296_1 [Eumeta japonica]|uniref:Uncharacterized protein n=1 Tax=Eumeta variegata TaxID=151549 RepID=A0A4C1VUT8_EUMVA|nr:hypothetical protein EVAR_29296_1 [Eumeta japonica]
MLFIPDCRRTLLMLGLTQCFYFRSRDLDRKFFALAWCRMHGAHDRRIRVVTPSRGDDLTYCPRSTGHVKVIKLQGPKTVTAARHTRHCSPEVLQTLRTRGLMPRIEIQAETGLKSKEGTTSPLWLTALSSDVNNEKKAKKKHSTFTRAEPRTKTSNITNIKVYLFSDVLELRASIEAVTIELNVPTRNMLKLLISLSREDIGRALSEDGTSSSTTRQRRGAIATTEWSPRFSTTTPAALAGPDSGLSDRAARRCARNKLLFTAISDGHLKSASRLALGLRIRHRMESCAKSMEMKRKRRWGWKRIRHQQD